MIHKSLSVKNWHEMTYLETSSYKGVLFTKGLDPNAFEHALMLISLVRPDESKYKAE